MRLQTTFRSFLSLILMCFSGATLAHQSAVPRLIENFAYVDILHPESEIIEITITDGGGNIAYGDVVLSDRVLMNSEKGSYALSDGLQMPISIFLPNEAGDIGNSWQFEGCEYKIVSKHPMYIREGKTDYINHIRVDCEIQERVSYILYSDFLGVVSISIGKNQHSLDGNETFVPEAVLALVGSKFGFAHH